MLLVVDVGNTATKVGLCEGARLVRSWQLTTRREQTADEYGLFVETLIGRSGHATGDITGVAISNVVPQVQRALEEMSERYLGVPALFVLPGVTPAIPLAVENPAEVGADRIVAAVAAQVSCGAPVIVVDLGTATRFDCVNGRGEFIGGAIAPGLGVAVDALVSRAARLSRVEIVRPDVAIGRTTAGNIRSGVVFGYAGLVDGMVARMRGELGGRAAVVATGGLAPLLQGVARSIEHIEPDLKLEGLRLVYERAHR